MDSAARGEEAGEVGVRLGEAARAGLGGAGAGVGHMTHNRPRHGLAPGDVTPPEGGGTSAVAARLRPLGWVAGTEWSWRPPPRARSPERSRGVAKGPAGPTPGTAVGVVRGSTLPRAPAALQDQRVGVRSSIIEIPILLKSYLRKLWVWVTQRGARYL